MNISFRQKYFFFVRSCMLLIVFITLNSCASVSPGTLYTADSIPAGKTVYMDPAMYSFENIEWNKWEALNGPHAEFWRKKVQSVLASKGYVFITDKTQADFTIVFHTDYGKSKMIGDIELIVGIFKIEVFAKNNKLVMNQWMQRGITTPERKMDTDSIIKKLNEFTDTIFKDFPLAQ